MYKALYMKLAPLLLPLFILTTVVFFTICVWRGEIIIGLQSNALNTKDREIKVIIEQQEAVIKVADNYEVRKADREIIKEEKTNEVEKIVLIPSYSNLCFDNTGLQLIQDSINTVNGSIKPKTALPSDTGVN